MAIGPLGLMAGGPEITSPSGLQAAASAAAQAAGPRPVVMDYNYTTAPFDALVMNSATERLCAGGAGPAYGFSAKGG